MIKITIYSEYITLGQFLKFSSVITNGGEAKMFLETNKVFVNNEEENRRGRKLYPGDHIAVQNKEFYIERK